MESINIEDMDCDTCLKMQEILSDEIDNTDFIKNNYMWEHIRKNNLFKQEEAESNYCIINA